VLSIRSSASPGLIKLDRTPYLREPMDKFSDHSPEKITLCTASQLGKTIFQAGTLGWEIDQDPGPSLFVMDSNDNAKAFSKERLQPLFEDCPSISRHIPYDRRGEPDKKRFTLQSMAFDTMTLNLVGSNSPGKIASRPIRRLRLDELDKFKLATEREASAAHLARERVKTFWNRKILQTSTPTISKGEIWTQFLDGDQRLYLVPCPHCHKFQRLTFDQVKWPTEFRTEDSRGRSTWDLSKVKEQTWYECVHCQERIEEKHRGRMLLDGHWEPTAKNPTHASYHLSSLYSRLGNLTWGTCAAQFLESKKKGNDALQNFLNSWLAEPWEVPAVAASEDEILRHRGDYKPAECPGDPVAVIITADVQEREIFFVVRAWGEFGTSWLLRYGMVQTLDQLNALVTQRHKSPGGDLFITHKLIDSGYKTDDIYSFCAIHQWVPVKGFGQAQRVYPVKLENGVLQINADYFKDALQTKLRLANDVPGAWLLHAGTGSDYASHIASERQVEEENKWGVKRKIWKRTGDNHWLDCEIYQLAVEQYLGLRFLQPGQQETAIVHSIQQTRIDGRSW